MKHSLAVLLAIILFTGVLSAQVTDSTSILSQGVIKIRPMPPETSIVLVSYLAPVYLVDDIHGQRRTHVMVFDTLYAIRQTWSLNQFFRTDWSSVPDSILGNRFMIWNEYIDKWRKRP